MSRKLVTIFGATGNQGGSVASLLLKDGALKAKYAVRVVTRDSSKLTAKELEKLGAELAQADLNDVASVSAAIKGSYAVFGVTNYWESMSSDKEVQQGKNIVDASVKEGVKHLVWSSLPNAALVSGGQLVHVQHFDGKAAVQAYAEESKKNAKDLLTTYFMPAYFLSNLKSSIVPGQQGVPIWNAPFDAERTNVPVIDINADTGKFVAGILEAGQEADGVQVQGVSQWASPSEIVKTFNDAIGKEVAFNQIPLDIFKSFLPPAVADELGENMVLIGDYDYYGKGTREKQAQSDRFLYRAAGPTVTLADFITQNGPWSF